MNLHRCRVSITRALLPILLAIVFVMSACGSKTPQEKLAKAQKLNQEQKYFDAMIELRKILKEHGDDPIAPDVQIELARTHAMLGQMEQAEDILKNVVDEVGYMDFRGQAAVGGLLEMYRGSGRFDDAIEVTENILEALPDDDPSTPMIRLSIAEMYMMNESYEEAIEILQDINNATMDLSGRISMAERMAVCYQKLDQNEEAVALYDDILNDIEDEQIRGSVLIGKAFYLKQGENTDEMNAALNEGMALKQKQFEESLDPLEKIRIKTEMARAYQLLDRPDDTESTYREIIENFSDQPSVQETYEALAVFLAEQKKWKEAREVLEAEKKNFESPIISQRVDMMIDRLSALELQDNSTSPSLSANDEEKNQ